MKLFLLCLYTASAKSVFRREHQGVLASAADTACFVPDRCVNVQDVKAPQHFAGDASAMTPEVCHQFCSAHATTYFGIKASDCWCGESYQAYIGAGPAVCDVPCEGDRSKMCGGLDSTSIWIMAAGPCDAAPGAPAPVATTTTTTTTTADLLCGVFTREEQSSRDLAQTNFEERYRAHCEEVLWSQLGADRRQCQQQVGTAVVEGMTQQECQDSAVAARVSGAATGHEFYSFKDQNGGCEISASCDSPVEVTTDWRIYAQQAECRTFSCLQMMSHLRDAAGGGGPMY